MNIDKNISIYKPLLIGMSGGFVSGLLGIGGSFITIPLLIGFLKIDDHKAHGTAIVVAFFASLSASIGYFHLVRITSTLPLYLIAGSLLGVWPGSRIIHKVPRKYLAALFSAFLILSATEVLIRIHPAHLVDSGFYRLGAEITLGLGAGFLSGFFGIGGGSVMVPGLIAVFGVSQKLAQGISLLVIIPTTLLGSFVHYKNKNIALNYLIFLATGAIFGGIIGSQVVGILSPQVLSIIFVLALLMVAASTLRRMSMTRKPELYYKAEN